MSFVDFITGMFFGAMIILAILIPMAEVITDGWYDEGYKIGLNSTNFEDGAIELLRLDIGSNRDLEGFVDGYKTRQKIIKEETRGQG